MKFIHTADWQIGMTFHGIKEKSRILMENDRIEVIDRIAAVANDPSRGIDFVLVCGDMFDSPRISEALIRKTLKGISKIKCDVYALAGNHEWNGTEYIFASKFFRDNQPANLIILEAGINPGPNGTEIVGAPLEGKTDEVDLIAAQLATLNKATGIRILAGHGNIDAVMAASDRKDMIKVAPIEAAIAEGKVHYVAMGDRHSTTNVGTTGAVWYSGAPEPTDYDENDQRNILVVEIKEDKKPKVEKVEVGQWEFIRFGTRASQHQLRSAQDLIDLENKIEKVNRPAKTLVKIYLDSILDFDTDVRRGNLFSEWDDETLGGFAVSESSIGAGLESDPRAEKVPEGLNGYALSAYAELKELAMSDGQEAETALEALKLLTRFVRGNS